MVPEASKEVIVTFNFPVDLRTILPFIRLQADGTDVPFTASRPTITNRMQLGPYENADRLVSLKPAHDLPRDADVKVRVLAGAKPRPENYGSETELAAGFHTLLPLAVEESTVVMGRDGATAELHFNHQVKEDSVAGNIRIDIPGYSVAENLEVSGSWVMLHKVPVDFGSSFTLTVAGGLTDSYGQTLGADLPIKLEAGPAASYVEFRGTGQKILEAQFPPRVAVEMQNIDEGRYVIGRIASPFGNPPSGPEMTIDAEKIPATCGTSSSSTSPRISTTRAKAPHTSRGSSRASSGAATPAGGEGRAGGPGHRHRCVGARELQRAPRPGELAQQGNTDHRCHGHAAQGGDDDRHRPHRHARSCIARPRPGSDVERLPRQRGEGGAGNPQGQGQAGAAAFRDALPDMELERAVFGGDGAAPHLPVVGPRHLSAGGEALLCRHRSRPRRRQAPSRYRESTGST